jgi:D-arabinan exo alpha-(1,3)/(1,5)-arabinofuranosidase (non-reducing end)
MARFLRISALALALAPVPAWAQLPPSIDRLGLTRPLDFEAFRSSSNNDDLASNDDSKRPIAGETTVLADLQGPGVVTHMWITVAATEYGWPRLLRLRVYYDGSPIPSVDAPLGDFFGVGHGMERPLSSLLVRDGSAGRSRNEYWPMPFKKSVKITLTNEGRRRVQNLYYHVDWAKYPSLPDDVLYFHARYRQALPTRLGAPYEILRVKGRGHYVGTVLSVVQNQPGWFGEGDDFFYVDGKTVPDLQGTGTEDYFNDAWSLRVADGPYAGVTVADGTGLGARMTAYRWHVPDPIPFVRDLRFDIEHAGWTFDDHGAVRSAFEEREDLFSTVAFWYQEGIAADQPEPPYGAARLPQGNATQIEVEKDPADAVATGGTLEVQKEVFWGKDILFFAAEGPGSRVDVPFDVPADGRYELVASMAQAPDYGIYSVLVDGKAVGGDTELDLEPGANVGEGAVFDSYYTEVFVGEDRMVGWPHLTRGRHTATFVCKGKNPVAAGYNLGLDALVLARVAHERGPGLQDSASDAVPADHLRRIGASGAAAAPHLAEITAALASGSPDEREAAAWDLTQMKQAAHPAVAALARALEDDDDVVRGLAALALRDAGGVDDAIVDRLAAHLTDSEDGVRMVSGWAIAAQGSRALRVLPALIAAGRAEPQDPHVQRAVADAIGAIGPAAREALPVLEDLARIPRVRWNASAAIRRVQGADGAGGGAGSGR